LRPHQWTKNLLLVLPLLTAHVWQEPGVWNKALLAIVAISLCASAVYIWNDLSDLEGDRVSPTKKNRPLAAGEASLPGAFFAGVMLLFAGGLIGTQVNAAFFNVLVVYTATALSYAVFLKRVLALDVILLAGLYTLRMYAGAAAVSVSVSLWLFAFSTFVFLSLGLAKRCAELLEKPGQMLPGRAYGPDDLSLLQAMGVASAFSSMVILALYVSSADVARLYFKPQPLWGLCLLHGFWMLRLWLLTQRGKVGADPVWWAVKDRGTYAVAFGAAVLMWCAGPR
jgi:4-hydroxybenzoate polyprenyltransferase